jgi:hypothetical protein
VRNWCPESCQTDHSRLVGQLAAHWGNTEFERPKPYKSVVRAATFHYGLVRYETNPLLNPETASRISSSRSPPRNAAQRLPLDSRLAGRHRSLRRAHHQYVPHEALEGRLQDHRASRRLQPPNPEPRDRRADRPERGLAGTRARRPRSGHVWTNYCLVQVWDLLGLHLCCQDPYDDYVEPAPARYGNDEGGAAPP